MTAAGIGDVRTAGAPASAGRDRKLTQLASILLLIALVACVIWWVLSQLATVPKVVGMTEADARKAIAKAGFAVGVLSDRKGTSAEVGKVVDQDPAAGSRVMKGALIDLGIASMGGLAPGASYQPPSGGTTGGSEDLLPPSLSPPARETTVDATPPGALQSGPTVPSVQGMGEDVALATLRSAGYRGATRYGPSTTDIPKGDIFYQEPAPDSYEPAGTTVVIWVSTGPPLGGEHPGPGD